MTSNKIILITFLLNSAWMSAQQVVNTSGGTNTHYDFNIGEPIVHTITQSSIHITQGLLQPRLNTETGQITKVISNHEIQFFPIPAKDILYGQTNFSIRGNLYIEVQDMMGKSILTKSYTIGSDTKFELNIADLSYGQYIIRALYKPEGNTENITNHYIITKN